MGATSQALEYGARKRARAAEATRVRFNRYSLTDVTTGVNVRVTYYLGRHGRISIQPRGGSKPFAKSTLALLAIFPLEWVETGEGQGEVVLANGDPLYRGALKIAVAGSASIG